MAAHSYRYWRITLEVPSGTRPVETCPSAHLAFKPGVTSQRSCDTFAAKGVSIAALFFPVWSPDGSAILFSRGTDRAMSLQRQDLNGRISVAVLETPGPKFPTDWSSDGRFVTWFTPWPDFKKYSIWVMLVNGPSPQQPRHLLLPGSFDEHSAHFSPAGAGESPRWIAYTSDETGSDEVHVSNFPTADRKWRVSNQGGWQPHWRRDGRELFYLTRDETLMAVEVKANADTALVAIPASSARHRH